MCSSDLAGWREQRWLGAVGSRRCLWAGRRTAASFPAATGRGRSMERVSGVVRVTQHRSGAEGGPGEVCSVDGDGGAVARADGVHARGGVLERRGRVSVWEMQGFSSPLACTGGIRRGRGVWLARWARLGVREQERGKVGGMVQWHGYAIEEKSRGTGLPTQGNDQRGH